MKNMWMWVAVLALIVVIIFIGYSFAANQKKFKPTDGCEMVCTNESGEPGSGSKPIQNCKKICPL